MRSTRWWRTRFFVFATISAVFALIVVGLGALASSTGSTATPSDDEVSEAQAALFVNPDEVPVDYCMKLVQKYDYKVVTVASGSHKGTKTPVFVVGATKNVPPRLWSDAVNTPLKPISHTAEQAVVCHDPAQAAMVMNRLGTIEVGGKTIAQVNPWMEAQGDLSAVQPWAQACLTDDIETHLQCAKTMSYTAALLGKFKSTGVHSGTSTWNVHLSNGTTVGSIPAFELNSKQEKGYWLTLSYTSKTGGVCLKVGFNVGTKKVNGGDQRIAGLPCKTPTTPTATPTATPTSTMPTTPTATPTPTPTCTQGPKPSDPEHTYSWNQEKCKWVQAGSSLNDGDQHQDVQPDRGNQASAQEQDGTVSTAPSAQPTKPANTASPADPTPGGYNGGSTVQPGQSGTPDPGPTQTVVQGDSGGF